LVITAARCPAREVLIYPPGVQWTGTVPPKPAYWMQQLTHDSEPDGNGAWLNGPTFAAHVRTALKERPGG
jgi:hypothetical protein